MKNPHIRLFINLGLLISGLIMAFSGLLIQIEFHLGNHGGIELNKTIWGLNHSEWSFIHKCFISIFTLFMIFHFILHKLWYKVVFSKKLFVKNKKTITLTIVFILVAITGYIPWLIKLTRGDFWMREIFIEIHDKIALILVVFLLLHFLKKLKWFRVELMKFKSEIEK